MGDMAAGELQDTLAAKRVLERLFADGAVAADEGAVAAGASALNVEDAGHASSSVGRGLCVLRGVCAVAEGSKGPRSSGRGVVGTARGRTQPA